MHKMFGNSSKKSTSTTPDDKSTSIISTGTSIDGDFNTKGSLRLDGSIVGNCIISQRLVLGIESSINGNITAKDAEISGTIKGIVKIEDILILRSTSKIAGDISTKKLIVEEGAQFNGNCTMGDAVNKSKEKIIIHKEKSEI